MPTDGEYEEIHEPVDKDADEAWKLPVGVMMKWWEMVAENPYGS